MIFITFNYCLKADAQNITQNELDSAFIYLISKNTTWPDEENLDRFKIAFVDINYKMIRTFDKLTKDMNLKSKKIETYLVDINDLKDIYKNFQVIYISKYYKDEASKIYKYIDKNFPILVISNSNDDTNNIMINLYNDKYGKENIQINQENIRQHNLEINTPLRTDLLNIWGIGKETADLLLKRTFEIDAGEILFFPAVTTGVVSLIVGFLLDRKLLSYKTSIIVGILVFTLGTYIQSRLDLDMSKTQIILLLLPWGAGMGFFFPALSQISLGNFQGELLRQASALQNLLRLVGGSVGTAISTYILISSQSGHLIRMGEKISPYSPQVTAFLSDWKQFLYYARSTVEGLLSVKAKAIMGTLFQKSAYWHSFGDAFFFATICGILTLIPALLIGKTPEGVKS
jgi:endonuclease III-like uncharacterized protein